VLRNGDEQNLDVNDLVAGDLVIVRAGERIAADGEVRSGSSAVDESMISGESLPVSRTIGDVVYAGTLNQRGSLVVMARSIREQTLLAHIVRSVEQAQLSKAPVQQLADKISGIFIPVIIAIAVISFIAWLSFGTINAFGNGLSAFVTVLAIACPCALGLATPIAITVAIGRAARKGILLRDAAAIENTGKLRVIVFDKTGTLTTAQPIVSSCYWYDNTFDNESTHHAISFAESRSTHPLSIAIRNYFNSQSQASEQLESFEDVPARGIRARVAGTEYVIGTWDFVRESAIHALNEPVELKGAASVYVLRNGDLLCQLTIEDQLKDQAKEALGELQDLNIEPHLVSGDAQEATQKVANALGINHVVWRATPQSKQEYVSALQNSGAGVAMAGDGVNDAQAMAQATLGIAMSHSSDITSTTAQIVLMNDDLRGIVRAIKISRETLRVIKQNLWWAFSYNIILIPIATGIFIPSFGLRIDPMYAGLVMALSDVIVVFNSLRLRNSGNID
jgi:Cu2+-exporting ATPase